jgi:hypothetical protein
MRLVRSEDRADQDALVEQIRTIFAEEARPPKVIDRRLKPVQGYRAVHIVAFPDGFPIEVQVRTRLQHDWAELFEKLADVLGRGIRYGEAAQHWLLHDPPGALDQQTQDLWRTASRGLSDLVSRMIAISDLIDVVERREQDSDGGISGARANIHVVLTEIRSTLDIYSQLPIELPSHDVT